LVNDFPKQYAGATPEDFPRRCTRWIEKIKALKKHPLWAVVLMLPGGSGRRVQEIVEQINMALSDGD